MEARVIEGPAALKYNATIRAATTAVISPLIGVFRPLLTASTEERIIADVKNRVGSDDNRAIAARAILTVVGTIGADSTATAIADDATADRHGTASNYLNGSAASPAATATFVR